MLTVYLSCLVVGGVFVALSAMGALGKDVDVDHDASVEAHAELDAGFEAHALEAAPELDAAHELTLGDASQGLAAREPDSRKLWLPVLSLRFWTFGAAFFGLTGTLLSTLTATSAFFVAAMSAATGIGVGTLSAWLVRWLRRPVGASVRIGDYSGAVGELMLPLRPGGITRIRLRVHERERTMLAVSPDPIELAAGTRVLVLGIDERGRAQIEPEDRILAIKEE
jgi:hypothetical protein